MSASQKTTHYNLPIYAGTDVTGWLSGFNPAMEAIDAALFAINQTAEDANGTAAGAKSSAQQAITSAQATAELVVRLNNSVTELANKTVFHSVDFTVADGTVFAGESNKDNSLSMVYVNIYGTSTIPSSYTVNGVQFHEIANCNEKLCSTVLSGSVASNFSGSARGIGLIPVKIGDSNTITSLACFYDNSAKKTRFGISYAGTVKVNDSGSSCANITFIK